MPWSKKPSPPPPIYHSCLRKKGFEHLHQAEGMAKRLRAKGSPTTEVYRCPHCKLFHVGRKPKPKKGD